jgi:geranylgeranyl pyrophosphate synthase
LGQALASRRGTSSSNLRQQYELKSGAFFQFVTTLPTLLKDLRLPCPSDLGCFGQEVGVGYQIADDIADACGNPKLMGKHVRMDVGKCNYATTCGVQFALDQLNIHHEKSMHLLQSLFARGFLKEHVSELRSLVGVLHAHNL